ncbi:MAG: Asp-tRNA(Asn)/Glu-tRNA(Gln) amidotransferase subunit GatC [Pseudomonadota bacterium]
MKITQHDVEAIANLARLDVDDASVSRFAEQMNRILHYIDILKNVDIDGVPLASGAAMQQNVFREDIVKPSPGPDVTLANAPQRDDDFYTVPRVVG